MPADHQEFTEDLQVSFAAISSHEFLKNSSVEIYSLDPDDDSLEFTEPSRDLDVHQASGDFAVFTFSDSKGRVDSSSSSAPHDGAVLADVAAAASQMDNPKSLAESGKSSEAPATCTKDVEKVCRSSLPSSSSTTSTSTLPVALEAKEALPASVYALELEDAKDAIRP